MNSPYRDVESGTSTSYDFLLTNPDNFDPVKSYEREKIFIISQIYEPLYTVAYKSQPPKLIPLTATAMPSLKFYDKQWREIKFDGLNEPAYTSYLIQIKPKIYYQPHIGFCKIHSLKDCKSYKRELKAEDFAYQIKRVALQNTHSPYASICSKYIYGFEAYRNSENAQNPLWHDLRNDEIAGVRVLGSYTLEIITKGFYQQWVNWMSLAIFTPMPWEIDQYYQQAYLANPWRYYSIGTGGYMLNGEHKFQQVVLQKNPNYREEFYQFPDGVKRVPVVDKYVFNVDVENIPRWNKFLQGYYDFSTIPPESFDNSVQIQPNGQYLLSDSLKKRQIYLKIEPISYTSGYVFNFLDPVVGGYGEKNRKLRQAISLVFNFDEFRAIFRNGRGLSADGPIPLNLMENIEQRLGYNHMLFDKINNVKQKKNLQYAKKLLAEAGYVNGIDPKTGKSLIINYSDESKGLPEEKAIFGWMRKQFEKLGLQLNIREYDSNHYHNKLLAGQFQMSWFSWSADYPDLENFLMLFYGPNQQAQFGGPNRSNFKNNEYDRLYEQFKILPDGHERDLVIKKMLEILWHQCVWVWGTHGDVFFMMHDWLFGEVIDSYAGGSLKYMQINDKSRLSFWNKWNRPEFKPIIYFFLVMLLIMLPFFVQIYRIRKSYARRTKF